jgi:hypothetical protein
MVSMRSPARTAVPVQQSVARIACLAKVPNGFRCRVIDSLDGRIVQGSNRRPSVQHLIEQRAGDVQSRGFLILLGLPAEPAQKGYHCAGNKASESDHLFCPQAIFFVIAYKFDVQMG